MANNKNKNQEHAVKCNELINQYWDNRPSRKQINGYISSNAIMKPINRKLSFFDKFTFSFQKWSNCRSNVVIELMTKTDTEKYCPDLDPESHFCFYCPLLTSIKIKLVDVHWELHLSSNDLCPDDLRISHEKWNYLIGPIKCDWIYDKYCL